MPKFTVENYLFPWEMDKDGKKLDEPAEMDLEKFRKYVVGVLNDKEQAQEAREEEHTAAEQAKLELKELQQKNENEEDRRAREQKERDKEIEDLRKDQQNRRKIEALEEAFPEATAARIKRLAKRVVGDEKDWVTDAKELVEDGFKISDKPTGEEESTEEPDGVSTKPVRRSNGTPVVTSEGKGKAKSVADELDAAGIGRAGW